MTEDVLIDFKVDFSELTSAQEQLAKSGKIDASGFTAVQKSITKTSSDTKGLIAEFKKVATTATKMGQSVEDAFGEGIQDALDEAGVSLEEFAAAMAQANQPTKTLKAELKELKEALAQAKLNGKDTGAEFDAMRARAGALADSIADANSEINNMASDTRAIDNVLGSVTALAGGFSAVQGAAALFGDENEDLQKALLKVNGAMALATGLQQIQNAVQKEGALTKLKDAVATNAQTAATTIYTFVTNGATIATKLLRAALIATGIGAIVVLVIALVQAISELKQETESAADAQKRLAEATERMNIAAEMQIESLKEDTRLRKLRAQAAGQSELQITAIEIAEIKKRIAFRSQEISAAIKNGLRISELTKAQSEDIIALNELQIQYTIDGNKAAEDAAKKRKENAKKAADAAKAAILAQLNDELAALQVKLLASEKESREELDLKKKIVNKKRDIDLQGEKLTINQIRLLREQANADRLKLDDEFNKRLTAQQLQAQLDTNNALLAGITLDAEARLQLQIETLAISSQLEINAAEGNAAKILLIEAKKYADIRALQNKFIQDGLQAELASVAQTNDIVKTGLNKLAADRKADLDARIAALKGIEKQELTRVDKRIEANAKMHQSDEEYRDNYKKLAEERAGIEAETSSKIAEVNDQDKEQRLENLKAIAAEVINIAGQVSDFFAQLSSLQNEREQQLIEAQKRQLKSLVEAGAITEKEAKNRAKQIEILERQQKQKQAQREKTIAVFNALLAIPSAILQGLKTGGPPLAAIYGALAAAQAALVVSRPVPKFFRGKKDNYSGPGEVADMGSEIVERNGRMFLYTKPTQTYLAASDKVYTAAETRQIMHNTNVSTTVQGAKQDKFDYEKLAKAMPKHSVAINIEKDFIKEAVADGLSVNNYFNKRYKF